MAATRRRMAPKALPPGHDSEDDAEAV
jgi:hypothetical protein